MEQIYMESMLFHSGKTYYLEEDMDVIDKIHDLYHEAITQMCNYDKDLYPEYFWIREEWLFIRWIHIETNASMLVRYRKDKDSLTSIRTNFMFCSLNEVGHYQIHDVEQQSVYYMSKQDLIENILNEQIFPINVILDGKQKILFSEDIQSTLIAWEKEWKPYKER